MRLTSIKFGANCVGPAVVTLTLATTSCGGRTPLDVDRPADAAAADAMDATEPVEEVAPPLGAEAAASDAAVDVTVADAGGDASADGPLDASIRSEAPSGSKRRGRSSGEAAACRAARTPDAGACNYLRYEDSNVISDDCFATTYQLYFGTRISRISLYVDGAEVQFSPYYSPSHVYSLAVPGTGGGSHSATTTGRAGMATTPAR